MNEENFVVVDIMYQIIFIALCRLLRKEVSFGLQNSISVFNS